ncbi:hypothetical protein GOP47_0012700 [Adiantum capillus-veneris]|uniref:4-coumarate--CoA ligase n=1 Tax=Adiantum capillus-veneris TaxID=13818 RepID=A0A9D4ZEN2_ADICA|nr:hypothetical protein GOP47_0012700 [Adiantum capillus-veneris]
MAPSIDSKSGFCAENGIFYSRREFVKLPDDPDISLPALIFNRPLFDPTALAFIDSSTGQTLTYGHLRSQVQAASAGLFSFGLRPGNVVLLLCPNCIAFPVILLAIMSVGAIVTTTNPLNHPSEIAHQAADSGAMFFSSVPSLRHKLPSLKLPLILLPEPESSLKALNSEFPQNTTLSQLLSSPRHDVFPTFKGLQEDTAALLYSSGTTGTSKGVIITHRNFIAQVHFSLPGDDGIPWTSRIYMCLLPMFHVYGMGFFASGLLVRGSTVVIQGKFEIAKTLESIEKYRVTHMPVVPPIVLLLTKTPLVDKFNLSSLLEVGSGAAPLSKEVMGAFRIRFPKICLRQGYGLTESTSVGAYTATKEESMHYGSVGRISANSEVKIICIVSGKPLPPKKKGEIWIRGPCIMKGYFGRVGETSATIDKESWLHTGDLGYIDEEGYLFVIDRLKELIKYKGFQVAPAELEAVLLSNPKIVDAAVVGSPDKEAGQVPMAFVVLHPQSSLTEVEVMEFVAEQVAPYKKIRRVAFVECIPKTASGKILRRQLSAVAASKL